MPFANGWPRAIQDLVDRGVFDRIPVSFSAFCFDQMKDWELLFPAEHSYFERLFGLLDRSPAAEVERLFAPMLEAERKMGVSEQNWPKRQFSLDQVDFLNRNPHYSEWRAAVAQVFARIDPLLDAEVGLKGRPRLAIVMAPSEIPADPDRLWLRIASKGKRVPVQPSTDLKDYIPLLLTGEKRAAKASTLAELCAAGAKSPYEAWLIEAAGLLTPVGAGKPGVVE